MKRFIETLKNIWRIEDLRARILTTLGLVLVYRLGSFVVLPGIDPTQLDALRRQTAGGLEGLLDMLSGGAFHNASLFALGIMPYISASIVVQLLTIAIPYFQRLQKEGESGRKKMNQITRWLTVLITAAQGPSYIYNLHTQLPETAFLGNSTFFLFSSVTILTAGTLFVMWLGERITDKGVGNGISLIIMIGIIARLPSALLGEVATKLEQKGGGMVMILVEIILLVVVIMGSIALVQATRRVPVQYAKRIVGNKQYGGVRQYIPLKINAAGVMPIIFAQAFMFIPMMVGKFNTAGAGKFVQTFGNYQSIWYNITFAVLIIAFTYFYTAVTVNPTQMAEDMKRNGGFIPGVKPGRKTVDFLDTVMSRITLPGSIFLAMIAILPAMARLIGVNSQFAAFFGGTSLLILVGVVLDTLQQIESHLLMRHYDGLMKSGRIKGRTGSSASI